MTEQERDAHLREALRHAPDAQVQPPPALTAFILNEARAKARDAAAPARPTRSPLASLWHWLARPSVAAGFAGVMAATLVGLMWWDQPMDEALPRRPAPAAAQAPAAATPAPEQAPIAPPVPAPNTQAQPRAPEPPRAALRKPEPQADKKKADAAVADAPQRSLQAQRKAEAAPAESAAMAERAEARPTLASPAAAPPVAAPAPAAPVVADAAAATAGVSAGAMASSKSAEAPKRLRSVAPADALSSLAAAPAERNEARAARPSIASVRAAIAVEPAHWAWQRGNGPAQDMSNALYAWLAQLEGATGSSWQARATPEAPQPLGSELRLLRDGRVAHGLRITERGVLWESGTNVWWAELPVNQLKALQAALDAAAP